MSNCFEKLRLDGRKLDEGINKMTKIWNAPHIYIGRSYIRYSENGENTENLEEESKANEAAEALSKSVAEMKESLFEDLEKSKKNLSEMQKFMEDSRTIYEDIKQQCSDIEILFTENGYVPETKMTIVGEKKDEKISYTNNSTKPEVESTPYLPWKSKLKTFDASTPEMNGFSEEERMKEAPVKNLETSIAEKFVKNNINYTPYRQSPREPILSKYYYELVKKKGNA